MPRSQRVVTKWVGGALLGVALSCSISATPAFAQDDTEAARLFAEGVALREAGDPDGAVDRLRRAYALDSADRTAFNLAAALVDRGELVEAQRLLRRVQARQSDLLIVDAAQALIEEITPRIAVVQLRVAGMTGRQRLYVDGAPSEAGPVGSREIPLEAGRHRFEVRDEAGVVLARTEVDVAEGERRGVTLRPVAPASAPRVALVGTSPARSDAPATPREEGGDADTWVWVGVGGGAALAVAIGVVIAVFAIGGGQSSTPPASGELPPLHVRGREG